MNYGLKFVTLYTRQGSRPSPWKRNAKRQKGSLRRETLQIAKKRREAKSKGEKERSKHLNAEFQRIARRDMKAFLSDQCKEIEENNRMGKTRHLFKKIRDQFNSVQFNHSVVSDSLRPHESQHASPPCPSPTPRVQPDSCPSSQ